MSMTCEPLLAALKECLMQSDCVLKQGHLPSECLRDHTAELPERCQSLRKATFECKRGLVCFFEFYRVPISNEGCSAGHAEAVPGK